MARLSTSLMGATLIGLVTGGTLVISAENDASFYHEDKSMDMEDNWIMPSSVKSVGNTTVGDVKVPTMGASTEDTKIDVRNSEKGLAYFDRQQKFNELDPEDKMYLIAEELVSRGAKLSQIQNIFTDGGEVAVQYEDWDGNKTLIFDLGDLTVLDDVLSKDFK